MRILEHQPLENWEYYMNFISGRDGKFRIIILLSVVSSIVFGVGQLSDLPTRSQIRYIGIGGILLSMSFLSFLNLRYSSSNFLKNIVIAIVTLLIGTFLVVISAVQIFFI